MDTVHGDTTAITTLGTTTHGITHGITGGSMTLGTMEATGHGTIHGITITAGGTTHITTWDGIHHLIMANQDTESQTLTSLDTPETTDGMACAQRQEAILPEQAL